MKKQYEKPTLAVEYYQLTQAIAARVTKIGFLDSACVTQDPDATNQMRSLAWVGYFVQGHCNEYPEGMDANDGICYHTNANAASNS